MSRRHIAWTQYLATRDARRALAERAVADPEARIELLGRWSVAAEAGRVVPPGKALVIPDGDGARRLCGWIHGSPGTGPLEGAWTETTFDLRVLADAPPRAGTAAERSVAGWYLLGRLGEEVATRDELWRNRRFPTDPRDREARLLWETMLGRRVRDLRVFSDLYADALAGAVRAVVAGRLQLAPSAARTAVDDAVESLETLPLDGYLDLAARVLEATGEPVAALATHLGASSIELVGRCVRSREAWRETWDAADRPADLGRAIPAGYDLHALRRVVSRLTGGTLRVSADHLPGWHVIHQNRTVIRARMRSVLTRDADALGAGILALPIGGLYQRTAAALRAMVIPWAFERAPNSLTFGVSTYVAAPCVVDPADEVAPIPQLDDEAGVRTALLLVIARGCWDDLRLWLAGAPVARPDTFYRCLQAVAARVGDPSAGERQRYRGMRSALEDSLEDWTPGLRETAARVVAVAPDSDPRMGAAIRAALAPDWDEAATPVPRRFLRTVRLHFVTFLADGGEAGAG